MQVSTIFRYLFVYVSKRWYETEKPVPVGIPRGAKFQQWGVTLNSLIWFNIETRIAVPLDFEI